jgi:hypothetical protein
MSKTVNLNIPKSAAERMGATEYVKAFERNCPDVRLTPDDREELRRLFTLALGNPQN